LSLPPLLLLPLRIAVQINDPVPEASAGELLLAGQGGEKVANRGEQPLAELGGRGAGGRVLDQGNKGPRQGAMVGKADGAIEPQAVGVKAGSVDQGVETGIVVEAGEVAVLLQGAVDGAGGKVQRLANLLQGDDGAMLAEVNDAGFQGGKWHV
jgi:hypothetical protein